MAQKTQNKKYDVKDLSLAPEGKSKIEWAGQQMQVLKTISARFEKEKTLKGLTIGCCLHITSETANLLIALKAGRAKVVACASNLLSTPDSAAASLVKDYDISVYAINGEDSKSYYEHLNAVLDANPQIAMDDGADLVHLLHTKRKEQIGNLLGSSEETTTGVIRLRAMEKEDSLRLPVVAVNDSDTKHLFDNRYGTGQSTIDGVIRATNLLLAGKSVVVGAYGWFSKGMAIRAKGMGSHVVVAEGGTVWGLGTGMDGFMVMD